MCKEKTIAVLMTVHNRCAKTIACLSCLYAQCLPNNVHLDVFMVDDGCTDGTADAVKEKFPQVHIIYADGSLYWNRGMYRAWEVAAQSGEYNYYLWLNDDTMLFPQAVKKMFTLNEEYDAKAIIVGATKSKDGEDLTYGGRIGARIPKCDGHPREVEYFNGNVVLIPKSVFATLGNLDYYYTHSKGDFDYGLRARRNGIKMYQLGEVVAICDAHEQIDSWCNPDIPLCKRWKLMHRPNGMPPNETFHFEKQISIRKALLHYITVHVRCIFPKMWIKRNL